MSHDNGHCIRAFETIYWDVAQVFADPQEAAGKQVRAPDVDPEQATRLTSTPPEVHRRG